MLKVGENVTSQYLADAKVWCLYEQKEATRQHKIERVGPSSK
jgi:hypothetical protein